MDIVIISVFVVYFCTLIGIGLYFYKRNQTAEDFMLGNRSVNYWVTAIATQATDMGSWLFLGLPAVVFTRGMFEAWVAIGLVVGMWLSWTFVAPKLREKTAELESLTLSSYFASCFGDKSGSIQLMSSCFALIFFTFYIASGLVGLSLVFSSAFGIAYETGIVLSLVTTALYTLIGGFVAVAWCDFFQGIFLVIMIAIVPLYAIYMMQGISPIISAAHLHGISLSLLSSPKETLWALFLAASWGLGYFGQPHILVNFMGIDDPTKLKAARLIGITWQILVLVAAVAIGIIGIGFFPEGLANAQLIFITITKMMFHPFVAGMILCAILAATLSTMDSLILVAGSTIAEDIYKKFIHPSAPSDSLLWVSRVGSIVISLIALGLAWTNNNTVYELVNYAWSGLGSTFGPLVLTSLYYPAITGTGALAGLIVGGTVAAVWPLFSGLLPLVPAFSASLLTIIIVSKLTQKPSLVGNPMSFRLYRWLRQSIKRTSCI